ncbi:UNVERIFIED_ORG: hypothetical protein LHK14_17910 [Roseateles sp. XES5]|nr:hypothetical protein [Roseateles sp. XES5]
MSTRTPGPWHVNGDTFDVVHQPTSFAGDRRIVARCATGDGAMANALLIAAAPDLLQAGKHLTVKLAEVYWAAGQRAGDCQAIRDWMAAVAKAESKP